MTTAPDMLKQFGGAPVSEQNFAGWWGNDVFFVDFDNGLRGQSGKDDMSHPQKDLDQAITDASAGDVIYMRPRTSLYWHGSSPSVITPPTATNWVVPQPLNHLSIIGTTTGGGLTHGVTLRSYASLTTATLMFHAQYCTIENLGFQGIDEQVSEGIVQSRKETIGTHEGYALTVNRCNFQVYKSSNAGALVFNSGRYNQCLNSTFWHNYVGIWLGNTFNNIHGSQIIGNIFRGATGDIDADIVIGDSSHTLIHGNIFDHAQPAYSSGIRLKYIQCTGTSTGIISNNYFATTEATIGTACSLGTMVDVANKCGDSTVWMTSS